jgi:glycerophosphoryl diester phosphodiesterase
MKPLLLGHRGARASRDIPENTLASFELCLQQGCDGFEFDVRRSADGAAVVCHDPVVRGMEIERTLATDLGLPSLEVVLGNFAARAFLDIELKVAGLEAQTVAALRVHPPQKGYVISSFLPDVLSAVRFLDPGVALGFLCEERCELGRWQQLPVEWVIPHFEVTDQELIAKFHEAGKRVMVWTVNQPDEMRKFAEWGVDGIISDETDVGARVLRDLIPLAKGSSIPHEVGTSGKGRL